MHPRTRHHWRLDVRCPAYTGRTRASIIVLTRYDWSTSRHGTLFYCLPHHAGTISPVAAPSHLHFAVCARLTDKGVTRLFMLVLPCLFEAGFFKTCSRTRRASSCLADDKDNVAFFGTVRDNCSAHHAFQSSSLHKDRCSDLLSIMLALTV